MTVSDFLYHEKMVQSPTAEGSMDWEFSFDRRLRLTTLFLKLNDKIDHVAIAAASDEEAAAAVEESQQLRDELTSHQVLAYALKHLQLHHLRYIASPRAEGYSFQELVMMLREVVDRPVECHSPTTVSRDIFIKAAVKSVLDEMVDKGNKPFDPLLRYVRNAGSLTAVFNNGTLAFDERESNQGTHSSVSPDAVENARDKRARRGVDAALNTRPSHQKMPERTKPCTPSRSPERSSSSDSLSIIVSDSEMSEAFPSTNSDQPATPTSPCSPMQWEYCSEPRSEESFTKAEREYRIELALKKIERYIDCRIANSDADWDSLDEFLDRLDAD